MGLKKHVGTLDVLRNGYSIVRPLGHRKWRKWLGPLPRHFGLRATSGRAGWPSRLRWTDAAAK